MIDEMRDSVMYWLEAEYRANTPRVAQLASDESPANALRDAIRRLTRRWTNNFDAGAPKLAAWFALAQKDRSDAALRKILKDAGFTVDWRMTAAMNDVMQATVGEQVGLIKSIPQECLAKVEGLVMRSVATGRDLGTLRKDLQKQFGVTRRRATLIARTQNNMASATLTRVRQLEAGITEAIWCHSAGGRVPRPSHVKASKDRVRYNVAEGWLDPAIGKRIWPGTEINCRCFARPVLPGFTPSR